jgi:2,4-dienoyl-CoA reductase-like NADH-dependent reductase (Old Yellow Enzyme family)
MQKPAALFSPLVIRDITFRNRIWLSPMCMYSSEDGYANEWHLIHLGSRAVGGAGLVMTEATAVTPEGRITASDLGLWNDDQIDALQPVTSAISEHGAVPAVQLAHAGRKAGTRPPWETAEAPEPNVGWTPVSPTARRFNDRTGEPHRLSTDEVHDLVDAFVAAAARAVIAGFKAIEIHAAHGYLIHQFLSPLANDRDDEYGGSFENRTRFLIETARATRLAIGDLPLFVRISATDWREDGWTAEDSVRLALMLEEAGVDLIDCSSGGIVPDAEIPVGPGFQTPFASAIRNAGRIMSGAVGLITSPEQADHIVRSGQADVVFLGREMLRDPYWPRRAATALGAEMTAPKQYARAW